MSYFSTQMRRYFDGAADQYFAADGEYRRGGTTIALRLKRLQPGNSSVQAGRFRIDAQTVCFRLRCADLAVSAEEIVPEGGDEIVYEGRTYVVDGGNPPTILSEGAGRQWHINAALGEG